MTARAHKPAPPDALMLTMDQAAERLGISKSRIGKLALMINPKTRKPVIFSVKAGKRRMFPARALEQYVEQLMRGEV